MNLQSEKIKLEKALRVIELIEICNLRIKSFKQYENSQPHKFTNYCKDRITITQGVKARLENYYKNLIK